MILLAESGGAFDAGFFMLIVAIVSIFILAFFLLFLRRRTFPLVYLWIIRLVHGQYSDQYLEFFKKNDLRNPLNNCIRDEITLHFSFFYRLLKDAAFFTTIIPVNEFKGVPFQIHYKQLVTQLGTPECINIARFNHHRVKVVGYIEPFQQRKMKTLFYFVEDQFIMGEYVFSETHRVDPTSAKKGLMEKYLDGKPVVSDTFYIEDPSGNMINYHDNGFFASIKYFYRSNEAIHAIISSIFPGGDVSTQALRKAMIHEELINRF